MRPKSNAIFLLMIFLTGALCLLICRYALAGPTGTIAFLSGRNGKPPREGALSTVYLINADGTNERKWLENPSGRRFGRVAWSPDGKSVAFNQFDDKQESHIFVMDLRTGEQKNITAQWAAWGLNYKGPAWSGDGKWLAAVCSQRDLVPGDICIMTAEGEGLKQLTRDPGQNHSSPSWSPDSSKIAFEALGEIFVVNRNGGNLVNLTNRAAIANVPDLADNAPAWSPDGRKIAFYSNREGNQSDIYVMDADGGNIVNLTNHPTPDRLPAWSPDGQFLAFMSVRDGNWNIYVMDANGANQTQVTDHPGNDLSPTWVIPDRSLSVNPQGRQVTLWGQLKSEKQ